MTDRQWLGDVALAVLLVLPTAALMWPSASVSSPGAPLTIHQVATGAPVAHSQIEQRIGLHR